MASRKETEAQKRARNKRAATREPIPREEVQRNLNRTGRRLGRTAPVTPTFQGDASGTVSQRDGIKPRINTGTSRTNLPSIRKVTPIPQGGGFPAAPRTTPTPRITPTPATPGPGSKTPQPGLVRRTASRVADRVFSRRGGSTSTPTPRPSSLARLGSAGVVGSALGGAATGAAEFATTDLPGASVLRTGANFARDLVGLDRIVPARSELITGQTRDFRRQRAAENPRLRRGVEFAEGGAGSEPSTQPQGQTQPSAGVQRPSFTQRADTAIDRQLDGVPASGRIGRTGQTAAGVPRFNQGFNPQELEQGTGFIRDEQGRVTRLGTASPRQPQQQTQRQPLAPRINRQSADGGLRVSTAGLNPLTLTSGILSGGSRLARDEARRENAQAGGGRFSLSRGEARGVTALQNQERLGFDAQRLSGEQREAAFNEFEPILDQALDDDPTVARRGRQQVGQFALTNPDNPIAQQHATANLIVELNKQSNEIATQVSNQIGFSLGDYERTGTLSRGGVDLADFSKLDITDNNTLIAVDGDKRSDIGDVDELPGVYRQFLRQKINEAQR